MFCSCSSDTDRRLAAEDRPEAGAAGRRAHPRLLPEEEPAGAEARHAGRARHPAQELQVTLAVSPAHRSAPPLCSPPVLLSSAVTPVMVDAVLAELPPLISESDMHVSQMALSFLSTLAVTHRSSLGQLSGGNILQQLIALVRSPLLQGGALAAMLDFYQVRLRLGPIR